MYSRVTKRLAFFIRAKKNSNLPSLKVFQMHKNCLLGSKFGP
jgi:hypothetical protein